MRLTPILSLYIVRHFLTAFAVIFIIFLGLILLFETVELLRRASNHENVSVAIVLKMGLMKLPFMGQQAFPFAVLFGAMAAFWRLTRNSELVVARAAGVSAWQFLLPVLLAAFLLGLVKIGALNPLASAMLAKFDRLNAAYLNGESNLLSVSANGLWLRQADGKDQSVIHATSIDIDDTEIRLNRMTVFVYKEGDKFSQRIDAKIGELEDKFWHLRDVTIHDRTKELPSHKADHWFATDITVENINDSFSPPETLSFWDLPGFIDNLDRAGFSAIRHKLYWHTLLAAPLLLCAMILIAATFTLRHSRVVNVTYVVAGGILAGFLLFFFSDVVFALGTRESIPVVMAAWTPSGVSTLLGLAMMFHLEDG